MSKSDALPKLRDLAARKPRVGGQDTAAPAKAGWVWLAALVGLAGAWALFAGAHSYFAAYTHDVFIFFDGIHRLNAGQVPHLDFMSPLGALGYYIPWAGHAWTGQYGGALEAGSVFVALALVPLAAHLAARRLGTLHAIAVTLAVLALCVVPVSLGEDGNFVSPAMHYNRFGWAMLLTAGLGLVAPVVPARGGAVTLGLAIGATLAALAFLKLNFFGVALGIPALMLLYGGARRAAGAVALATLGAVLAGVALGWPGFAQAYLSDLRMAFDTGGVLRRRVDFVLVDNIKDVALVGMAFILAAVLARLRWQDVLVGLYLVAAAVVAQSQNHQHFMLPALILGFAFLDRHLVGRPQIPPVLRLIAFGFTMVLLSPQLVDWVKASLRYAEARLTETGIVVELPGIEGVKVRRSDMAHLNEGLLRARWNTVDLQDGPEDFEPLGIFNGDEYIALLTDGVELLRRNAVADATVLAFDFSNAFSMMLDLPRRSGGYNWLHPTRNLSAHSHLPPEDFFAGVDYVMEPYLTTYKSGLRFLQQTYGPALISGFEVVERSEMWTLYRRRGDRQ